MKPVESLEECMKLKEDGFIVMAENGKKVRGLTMETHHLKLKNLFGGRDVGIATSNAQKQL